MPKYSCSLVPGRADAELGAAAAHLVHGCDLDGALAGPGTSGIDRVPSRTALSALEPGKVVPKSVGLVGQVARSMPGI